jgi:hypothetical protein
MRIEALQYSYIIFCIIYQVFISIYKLYDLLTNIITPLLRYLLAPRLGKEPKTDLA